MSNLVIVRVPLRISFLGGGSDLPLFHENYGRAGCVLSCTIDNYVYIVVKRRKNDKKLVASYSQREEVDSLHSLKNDYVRETLKWMNWQEGIEIHSMSDVSLASTGLGGSSTFLVGLILAIEILQCNKEPRKEFIPELLAEEAFMLETGPLGNRIGRQDHYATAIGGMNCFDFVPSSYPYVGPVVVNPINFPDELENNLLLLYTGKNSGGKEIFSDIHENKDRVLPLYNHLANLARKGTQYAKKNQWDRVFSLLRDAWILKRGTSSLISNSHIDKMYDEVCEAGAHNGKLCGSGSGGTMLFYCKDVKKTEILHNLQGKYQELRFKFTRKGAEVLLEVP